MYWTSGCADVIITRHALHNTTPSMPTSVSAVVNKKLEIHVMNTLSRWQQRCICKHKCKLHKNIKQAILAVASCAQLQDWLPFTVCFLSNTSLAEFSFNLSLCLLSHSVCSSLFIFVSNLFWCSFNRGQNVISNLIQWSLNFILSQDVTKEKPGVCGEEWILLSVHPFLRETFPLTKETTAHSFVYCFVLMDETYS